MKVYGVTNLAKYQDFLREIDGTHMASSGCGRGERYQLVSAPGVDVNGLSAARKYGYKVVMDQREIASCLSRHLSLS